MYGESNQSLRLTFQPTNRCNLNCSYCYQNNKGAQNLPTWMAKKLIDKIFSNDKEYFKGFLQDDYLNIILDFIGGEATLCMDFVNDVTDYFIAKCVEFKKEHWLLNFEVWLETNGTTYFQPKVQEYIKRHVDRMDLPITLDGSKECHDACRKYYDGRGSFDDVYKAIKHYIATYGKYPNTKITISPNNVEYMFDAIKTMIDLGYHGVRLSCVNEDVWDKEHDDIFREQLEKYYDYLEKSGASFVLYPYSKPTTYKSELQAGNCGTNGNMLCLDCHGKIYLCHRFTEISDLKGKESLSIGNIDEGITENGLQIIEEIRKSMEMTENTPSCKNCAIGGACESCPAFNYEHYGRTHGIIKTNCHKMRIAHEVLLEHYKQVDFGRKMSVSI